MELWSPEQTQELERQANRLLAAAPSNTEYPSFRKVRNWRRRAKEAPFCEGLAEDRRAAGHPEAALHTDVTVEECAAEMDRAGLSEVERACIYLTEYHAWTQNDVARVFGVTDRTIRNRLKSAFRKLAALRGS